MHYYRTLPNLARCFNRPWPGAGTSPDWPGPAQQLPAAPASPPVLLPVPVDHAWALAVWPILWILPGLSAALLLRALAAGPILWILPGLSAALLLLLRALAAGPILWVLPGLSAALLLLLLRALAVLGPILWILPGSSAALLLRALAVLGPILRFLPGLAALLLRALAVAGPILRFLPGLAALLLGALAAVWPFLWIVPGLLPAALLLLWPSRVGAVLRILSGLPRSLWPWALELAAAPQGLRVLYGDYYVIIH